MGRQAKRLDGHSSYRRGVLRGVTVGIAISTVKELVGGPFRRKWVRNAKKPQEGTVRTDM